MQLIINIVINNYSTIDTIGVTGNLKNLAVMNNNIDNGIWDNGIADLV